MRLPCVLQALTSEQEKVKELLVQKDLFLLTKRELTAAQARIEQLEDKQKQDKEAKAAAGRRNNQAR